MFLTNGWGSHSNRLFVANGWPIRLNSWHKQFVNGKPFEKGKSLVFVFLSKVTNIKSLNGCNNKTCWMYNHSSLYEKTVFALHVYSSARIYAILSFNTAEIDSPFGWSLRFEEQRTLLVRLASCFKKTRYSKLKEELKRKIKKTGKKSRHSILFVDLLIDVALNIDN